MFANGRLQLRCAALDVEKLSERELCLAVFMINGTRSLMGSQCNQADERDDLMGFLVLINGDTLTDAGRDVLRQFVRDHVERLRERQASDRASEERTRRKTYSPTPRPRPDLGVTLASIAELPHTNE